MADGPPAWTGYRDIGAVLEGLSLLAATGALRLLPPPNILAAGTDVHAALVNSAVHWEAGTVIGPWNLQLTAGDGLAPGAWELRAGDTVIAGADGWLRVCWPMPPAPDGGLL